jgi:hypothetical protein
VRSGRREVVASRFELTSTLADERTSADDQQGLGIGSVVGELFGDLTALSRLHLAAQYDD